MEETLSHDRSGAAEEGTAPGGARHARKKSKEYHLAQGFLQLVEHGGAAAEELFEEFVVQHAARVAPSTHTATELEEGQLNPWLTCATAPEGIEGRGLRAACRIASGSVILVEPALVVTPTTRSAPHAADENGPLVDFTRWLLPGGSDDQHCAAAAPDQGPAVALLRCALRRYGAAQLGELFTAYHPSLMDPASAALRDAELSREAAALTSGEADPSGLSHATAAALLHTVRRTMIGLSAGPSHLPYGVGLFPATALANHACLPNARYFHVRDHSIMVAVRAIARDEPVTVSYMGILALALTEPRRRLLRRELVRSHCGFSCRCDLCTDQARLEPAEASTSTTSRASARFEVVQRMCHAQPGVPVDAKLRLLANFLKHHLASDEPAPMDDFDRLAVVQWCHFFVRAAWSDPEVYAGHSERALTVLPLLVRTFAPDYSNAEELVALKVDALASAMYGMVRAYSRVCGDGGTGGSMCKLASLARRALAFLALVRMPSQLAVLQLLAAAAVDQLLHVFSLAANLIVAKANRFE